MESAIVCAARQFVGFEICKELLNHGYNVIAIDNELYLEKKHLEKWMEIGRNANLFEQSIKDSIVQTDSPLLCFIPFVDLVGLEESTETTGWGQKIESFLENNSIVEFIFIFPSQLLDPSYNEDNHERILYKEILNQFKNKKVIEFYVPTLYGPWQPEKYLFQQLIEGKSNEPYLDDCNDALYIEDAIKSILESINEKTNKQRILLQNAQPNTWRNCILYLNESYMIPADNNKRDLKNIKLMTVQEKTHYQEGLTLQIDCFKRMQG
jgi:nucleoside-diphosphate-sugar epimerase